MISQPGGKDIGDAIPPSQSFRCESSFLPVEQKAYDVWQKVLKRKLLCKLPAGKMVWNMAKYRELPLITTWLRFRYVQADVKAGSMRKALKLIKTKKLPKVWIRKAMGEENNRLQHLVTSGKLSQEEAWEGLSLSA
jgi:hypothetical protein